MAPIEKMNGIATHRKPRHPRSRRTPPFHLAPQGKCKDGNEGEAQGGGPFFSEKKRAHQCQHCPGESNPCTKGTCPTHSPALPRAETGDPPSSEEGVRVSSLVGAERGISVPATEGPNAPPHQRVTRRSQAPEFAKRTQKGRTNRDRGGMPAGQATHAVPKMAWRRL